MLFHKLVIVLSVASLAEGKYCWPAILAPMCTRATRVCLYMAGHITFALRLSCPNRHPGCVLGPRDGLIRPPPPPLHTHTSCAELQATLAVTWARQLFEAGLTPHLPVELLTAAAGPGTASPSRGLGPGGTHDVLGLSSGSARTMVTEAARRYHAANTANLDVFRYRHSGGIAPLQYKASSVRGAMRTGMCG
jgi:hypothetical protein